MKKKIACAVKFVLFLCITVLCVGAVQELLIPKYYYNSSWPTTNTFKNFYKLEKDSVDVLILGSSHAASGINPQIIYDEYGITSYNLGSEQQSLVISYYWLREALKYQSPKLVVLDTYLLHKYKGVYYVSNGMNCNESAVRKAMDCMRWSPLKWEAGKVIESLDPSQSALSFTLPNIRYHTRWYDLSEEDYTQADMLSHGGVKGFTVLGGRKPGLDDVYLKADEAEPAEAEPMVDTMELYLDKITELCNKNGIQLILVSIPCSESVGKYKALKEYAKEHGLFFCDFNEEELYHKIDYHAAEDLLSHPNYIGAEKISSYLGGLFLTEYGVAPRDDASFDVSRKNYIHQVENLILGETDDICDYLDRLNCEDYSIFIYAPNGYDSYINDDTAKQLNKLGFQTELRGTGAGTHFFAVKDGNKITEKLTSDDVSFSGSIRNGTVLYHFCMDSSYVLPENYIFSLKIDGEECVNSASGLHIIVYDNENKNIIDKICFSDGSQDKKGIHY